MHHATVVHGDRAARSLEPDHFVERHARQVAVVDRTDPGTIAAVKIEELALVASRDHPHRPHRVVDVGCGSLRAGRLLIPYLRPGHYCGLDPNRWLIEEGIKRELGRDLVRIKRPRFAYADDFSLSAFRTPFDYAMAHSIFSHAYADFTGQGLKEIAKGLSESGLLLATYIDGDATTQGSGWLYPGCVTYTWDDMLGLISNSGLVARRLDWMHPRQAWFAAARPGDEQRLTDLADRLRQPLADKK